MASITFHVALCIRSSFKQNGQESNKQKLHCVKINGSKTLSMAKVDFLRQEHGTPLITTVDPVDQHSRQNIPTDKQLVDPYRQGIINLEGVGYGQTVVIRSYEVGPDKTATLESILNLLQVTKSLF